MMGTTLQLDGAPLSQFELAKGLIASGFRVSVFVKEDGPLRERYEAHAIPVAAMPELACSAAVPAWYETDVATLAGQLRQGAPDLVLASTIDAFEAIDAARLAGIASIWNIREGEVWRERLADRHTAIAARALAALSYPAAVIFVAVASMKSWESFIQPDRRHLIYNATSVRADARSEENKQATRARLGMAPDEWMAVSVGTLCERKSQVDFARALADTPDAIRPVFVGMTEPGYREKVEAALGEARRRAIFTSVVPDATDLIASADALVCSSRFEAFPRTLLEAAAAQTPIIATSLAGTQERLTDGESALLYPPGDIASLSAQLKRLASDRDLGARLAKAAHEKLTQTWSHANMIAAYADLIRKALAT
ncbi:MAG: glycosyltransferase family 4 protein [Hyphomonadaceae bacterium]